MTTELRVVVPAATPPPSWWPVYDRGRNRAYRGWRRITGRSHADDALADLHERLIGLERAQRETAEHVIRLAFITEQLLDELFKRQHSRV
jgi:hypothetical protein